jgi:uncharacterized protein (DUF302 family)
MYGFSTQVNMTFEEATSRVTELLKEQGFGILTEINAHKVVKDRLGLEMRPYRILGACNPNFAHRAIEQEPDIGLLLPCNVLIREEADGSITVAFMDPQSVMGLVQRRELEELGTDVRQRLLSVRDSLQTN